MVTAKFASHCTAAATASAIARIELGNISPSSTHTTGPHVAPKNTTKPFAPMSAAVDQASLMVATPSASSVAVENAADMSASVKNMPTEPINSNRRLPILSTSAIATIVTTMFVTDVMVEVRNASSSEKPTDCHSVVE